MRFRAITPLTATRRLVAAAALFVLPGLAAAQSCPSWDLPAASNLSFSAADLGSPQNVQVLAGGSLDLSNCPDVPGSGYVAPGSDFEISLTGMPADHTLVLRVTSACDTTLLANDWEGAWHYSDDGSAGFDPELFLPAADGVYDVWIGTFGSDICEANFSLELAAGTVGPAVGACPDVGLSGAPLAYSAADLAQGQSAQVVAGGEIDLMRCSEVPGGGHVAMSPDFELTLSGAGAAGTELVIGVVAQCDAVLLVNDATGQWTHADDTNGTDPEITLAGAVDGTYDIWVGTFGPDLCDAQLTLRTVGAAGAAPAKPGATPPAPPPADPAAPPPKPTAGNTTPAPEAQADPGNLVGFRDQTGATLAFTVTGTTEGVVWGTDLYTDDSTLAAAAVHAGVLQAGQTGVVTVTITGEQAGFTGSERNGIASRNYGSWGGSYTFVP